VTGAAETAEGVEHAFLWDGTTMLDLNALIHPADPLQSFVTLREGVDFNDLGQILGAGVRQPNYRAPRLRCLTHRYGALTRHARAARPGPAGSRLDETDELSFMLNSAESPATRRLFVSAHLRCICSVTGATGSRRSMVASIQWITLSRLISAVRPDRCTSRWRLCLSVR
jgi:probable HAF family extracellular repeat protein